MCDSCCTPFIEGEGCSSALQKKASNIASGDYSIAVGHGNIASNEGELASGKYNKPNEGQLFSVGVGTSDSNRANAIQVNADGSTSFLYNGASQKLVDIIRIIGGGGGSSASIQMRNNGTYIQYNNGSGWQNLIALSELTGATGAAGPTGPAGKDADLSKLQLKIEGTLLSISRDGGVTWSPVGNVGGGGSGEGGSGYTPLLRVNNGYIEVSYDNGATYVQLLSLASITGPAGSKGEKGDSGNDGVASYASYKSIVFRRGNTTPSKPNGGTYADPIPPGWSDGIPSGTEKLWMSTRWFSNNESINVLYDWSDPSQATDTADIDFEYSNAPLTTSATALGTPTTNKYSSSNPYGWYDGTGNETRLRNANWMAIQKIKNGSKDPWLIYPIRGERGSDGTDGVTPSAHFRSIVFKRTDDTTQISAMPDSAGSYENPAPTGYGWSDGIPTSGGPVIWQSSRLFSTDPTENDEHWSTPSIIGDNGTYDFEFCDEDDLPAGFSTPSKTYPAQTPPYSTGDPWYDDVNSNARDPKWMAIREKNGSNYVTNSIWKVIRIKGENGQNGTSVTPHGSIFGIFDSVSAAQTYYNEHEELKATDYAICKGTGSSVYDKLYKFIRSGSSSTYSDETSNLEIGDFYLDSSGNMWVWDGDNFLNAGAIKGPKGDQGEAGVNAYLHIKYTDDPNSGIFTYNPATEEYDGKVPGKYIGMYWDNTYQDSLVFTKYEPWRQWHGEDGFGNEFIFILTNEVDDNGDPIAPLCPTAQTNSRGKTFQDDDFVPDDWSDDLLVPTLAYPYCWYCLRKKIDGVWQPFRGNAFTPTYAALWNKFVRDGGNGRGIDHIVEFYATSTVYEAPAVTNPNTGAPYTTTAPDLSNVTVETYLWNFERIYWDSGDEEYHDEPIVCIGKSIPGKGIARITEYYYASKYKTSEEVPASDDQWGNRSPFPPQTAIGSGAWQINPLIVNAEKPYLWNREVITYSNGDVEYTTPVIIAYYTYTDIEYIKRLFENVSDSNDAILTGYLGVYDENRNITAMINGGDDIIGTDESHGKLLIASGMNGIQTPENVDSATFKVYEDGNVYANKLHATGAEISGRIDATSGSIGPLTISSTSLSGTYGGADGSVSSMTLSPNDFTVYQKRPVSGTGGRVNSTGTLKIANDNQDGFVEINYERQSVDHPEPALYVNATNSAIAMEVSGGVFIDGTLSGRAKIRTTDTNLDEHDSNSISLTYRDSGGVIDVASGGAQFTLTNGALIIPGFNIRIIKTSLTGNITIETTEEAVNWVLVHNGTVSTQRVARITLTDVASYDFVCVGYQTSSNPRTGGYKIIISY